MKHVVDFTCVLLYTTLFTTTVTALSGGEGSSVTTLSYINHRQEEKLHH